MKFAIICCLLAFFACQLVLADVYQDQINDFKKAKEAEIQKLIDAGTAQQKAKTISCQVNFAIPVKNTVEKVCFPELAKCPKQVKTAEQCTKTQVATCINEIQFIVDNTKKCITEKSY
ncbi:uncharacterized protein LOC117172098 [Belonocnema kinseyi]|uniref:uncharacterized protein LOC117172098 n=1 Tax=Belonocnema kinseyi TaxID=2817044 RepID=UPI00143E03FB|nr:uncharacterized protein LOC117172098 [Belonocnema kinseyi]